METLHYSIMISSSKEKVWSLMLGEAGYQHWASVLSPGAHFVGSWEEGSKIDFLDAHGNGFASEVVANRPFQFIAVMQLHPIIHGVKQIAGAEQCPAFLEIEFSEQRGMTQVHLSIDGRDEAREMLDELYGAALARLKQLCEKPRIKRQQQRQMV